MPPVSLLNAPFRLLTWKSVLFHLVTFPIALFYFVLAAVGISLSVGLLVVVVGFFIGYGVLWLIHGMAPLEAWFVTTFLDTPIRASLPDPEGAFLHRYRQMLSSPSTWARIGYIPLKLVMSVVGFSIAVSGMGCVALVLTPLLYDESWFDVTVGTWTVDTFGEAIAAAVTGLVLGWVLLYVSVLIGRLVAVVARAMVSDPLYGPGPSPGP